MSIYCTQNKNNHSTKQLKKRLETIFLKIMFPSQDKNLKKLLNLFDKNSLNLNPQTKNGIVGEMERISYLVNEL